MKELIIGNSYYIFNGIMIPFKAVLTELINGGNTAIFYNIPRKATSVYLSKEIALKINKY